MSAMHLKGIMEAEDKRVIDIASELQISPNTVAKYLRGERVNRAIQRVIQDYIRTKGISAHPANHSAVAG